MVGEIAALRKADPRFAYDTIQDGSVGCRFCEEKPENAGYRETKTGKERARYGFAGGERSGEL